MLLSLPVLSRVQAETPAVMLLAAEARLHEAETLLSAQQWDGAFYLAGYVAEMLLKVAYCKIDPSFGSQRVVDTIFGPAAALWKQSLPNVRLPSQYKHSLFFWEQVLGPHRKASGVPPIDWGNTLLVSKHLRTIRLNWRVDLRYQSSLAVKTEAQDICAAARWLFDNKVVLWS